MNSDIYKGYLYDNDTHEMVVITTEGIVNIKNIDDKENLNGQQNYIRTSRRDSKVIR